MIRYFGSDYSKEVPRCTCHKVACYQNIVRLLNHTSYNFLDSSIFEVEKLKIVYMIFI